VKLDLDSNVNWVSSFEGVLKETSEVPGVSKALPSPDTLPSKKPAYPDLMGSVLLAEDNVVNQALVSRILKKFGVDVVLANDGVEACDYCARTIPDLILMDVNMPNRNGIDAVKIIREDCEDVPIYVLTAETDKVVLAEAMDAGSQGFLSKPINKVKLYEVLEKHLVSPGKFVEEEVEENIQDKKYKNTIAEVAINTQSSRVLVFSNNKPKDVLAKGVLRFSDALPQINEFVRDLYENERWGKLEEVMVHVNGVAGECRLDDLSRNSGNLLSALREENMDEIKKWVYWVDKGIRQTEKDEKISNKKNINKLR
ncbi:MAG: response regulator, partial [Pseudomonadales bacterium]|nr:response regulator [Pseudomonadales bacterium]